jgi:hypothetical protein
MATLQAHFGQPKSLGNPNTMIRPLIDHILLDQQSCFFQIDNAKSLPRYDGTSTLLKPNNAFVEKFGYTGILNNCLSKWFKLVKICMVMVLGNMKDECTFLNIVFMKTKLWNHLMIHLDLVVWMYAHDFYNYGIF